MRGDLSEGFTFELFLIAYLVGVSFGFLLGYVAFRAWS